MIGAPCRRRHVAGTCASRGRFSNAATETFESTMLQDGPATAIETAVAPETPTLAPISPARENVDTYYVQDIRTYGLRSSK